mmetsp:Transcript_85945/g.139359  ORF Transcript_85945/g.139359 Transcript_85945/m.139359 type:complete len:114 (-) Transcript_85945:36-377(-)
MAFMYMIVFISVFDCVSLIVSRILGIEDTEQWTTKRSIRIGMYTLLNLHPIVKSRDSVSDTWCEGTCEPCRFSCIVENVCELLAQLICCFFVFNTMLKFAVQKITQDTDTMPS